MTNRFLLVLVLFVLCAGPGHVAYAAEPSLPIGEVEGQPLAITCVCTGNSRRSILSATMVSVSAAYYGLSEIRGYSGGTKPSAFNERTVKTLREIGLDIASLGEEAARGDAVTANPVSGSFGTSFSNNGRMGVYLNASRQIPTNTAFPTASCAVS